MPEPYVFLASLHFLALRPAAGQGIGLALTQALLERSFAVGACSRNLEPLQILQQRFSQDRCVLRRMDVRELEEASRTLEALIRQLGDVPH